MRYQQDGAIGFSPRQSRDDVLDKPTPDRSRANDPKSEHWDVVTDLLTDWQFLEAKAEAQP